MKDSLKTFNAIARFDVAFYHKGINMIARFLPPKFLGIAGKFLFQLMMIYLHFISFVTHGKRERLIEYQWVLNTTSSGLSGLNVGCGDSLLDYELADRFCKYISIDLQKYLIAVKNPKIEFVQADITYAPFKECIFDIIVCISTIEHIKNVHEAMKEMCRVLKHGGLIYISMPCGRIYYNNDEQISKLLLDEMYQVNVGRVKSYAQDIFTMIMQKR